MLREVAGRRLRPLGAAAWRVVGGEAAQKAGTEGTPLSACLPQDPRQRRARRRALIRLERLRVRHRSRR
eukprot:scaffold68296_cov32-Tisochrysis_lutea.AAC.1